MKTTPDGIKIKRIDEPQNALNSMGLSREFDLNEIDEIISNQKTVRPENLRASRNGT
jgi:hypothetical protein